MELDPRLAALRPLGGFFVLHTSATARATSGERPAHPGGPADPRTPTLAEAYRPVPPGGPPGPLDRRVAKVARGLRAPEPRVAASVAQLGLAARLWSVTLGCAALYGAVPDLAPALVRWDAEAGAPDDLRLDEVRPLPATAAAVADVVLSGHLVPLAAAVRARHRLAEGLLWGNAGSALAGAARQLDTWARSAGRADTAARSRDLTARLFAHPLLAATGTGAAGEFRRRSCCLYYRVPGAGVCGDCCFTRPPRSSPRAPSG
ncbi:hypothetical protein SZN_25250 [Streptomyces zinciresistens K42]|uniref:Ferric siderophore reductase C-terminal domain-containing protein n=1 Tax=Streptomyces zinciresistens K42 TaxID=700597 RepID=G2GHR1_9ACTN|nr:(2Fe-2S)-binding protein [Streptomyces zinciresistens]EGX56955.1 hypothetical protein SZN_25250 [Streptomyces zinciresistens K42]